MFPKSARTDDVRCGEERWKCEMSDEVFPPIRVFYIFTIKLTIIFCFCSMASPGIVPMCG